MAVRLASTYRLSSPALLTDGFTGRVATTVGELVEDGLADVLDEAVWTSPSWWRFVEQDADHEICYLVIEDERSHPVAVAPALLIRGARNMLFYNGPRMLGDFSAIGSADHLEPGERETATTLAARLEETRERWYPSLTVGVFGSSLGLRPFTAAKAAVPEAAVPALAAFARTLSGMWGCRSFALLYLTDRQDEALREQAAAFGLRRSLMGAEAVLDVPVGGFDDYLRTLPSARRVTVRREMRAYAEHGVTTRVDEGVGALTDDYLGLRSALRAKYGHEAGVEWARREFAALREQMGDRLTVFSARRGERVVGYLMAFRVGDVLYTRAAGFDYEASAGTYCYFNLVYYDVIRWAQREGVRRIHYGLGTSRAKHHRGCSFHRRWAYLHLPGEGPRDVDRLLGLQHLSGVRHLAELGCPTSEPPGTASR